MAARTYHGRYLTSADFDARSRFLLRRVQDAIDAVISSEICRAGLLDRAAAGAALSWQEWDVALTLREHARLRASRSELSAASIGSLPACVVQAAEFADASIARRIEAVERYAAEVGRVDAAYRNWQQQAARAELTRQHLDMLARTAADEQGIAEVEVMSREASAIDLALREPPG